MPNNEKKRSSSQSVDALTLSSNKLKQKGGQPSPQKITSTPSPKKPKLNGIATCLSGASKKELDDLLTWMKVRKKDTSAHAKEKWGTAWNSQPDLLMEIKEAIIVPPEPPDKHQRFAEYFNPEDRWHTGGFVSGREAETPSSEDEDCRSLGITNQISESYSRSPGREYR